jgi:hypothetical protein
MMAGMTCSHPASNGAPRPRATQSRGLLAAAVLALAVLNGSAAAADLASASGGSADPSADVGRTGAATAAGAVTAEDPSRAHSVDTGANDVDAPTSTEQGQTGLTDSFERRPVQALLHESRLVGLRDTTFSVQLRSFDLDRENFNGSDSQAWALGGSAGVKTGYFGNFAALGATVYTSQRLQGPLDEDGTKLLQPGQQAYTAIGELYGQFRLTDRISAIVGRRGFDTPFINTQDSLMTPNTFDVYAVQGVLGTADDTTSLRFGAGFFDKIKPRNAEDFESMATAAGARGGVDRGVAAGGGNFKTGQFSIGAIEYYCSDIMNIIYAETKYAIPLANRVTLRVAAQYTDQHSTGEELLTGKHFSAAQNGFKAEIAVGPALFTVARTVTAVGTRSATGSGTDMRNPWGGYPGYTAVQIENFYRGGENATLTRAAYNFPRVTGLSIYALMVHGSTPAVYEQYAQTEYDANLQWVAQAPRLRGLTLLVRYGHVQQQSAADQHENELRLVAYYKLR